MDMKTFAFKLAERKPFGPPKWRAQDGVSVAGCTGPDYRSNYDIFGVYRGPDGGYWC
jgi:hypothetical protein